ncbi:MAG: AAA family ATPase, partial [Chloroflexota bacterium]|nr:AAA family ATPase [Chloroflexota bacterium]
DEIEKAHPDVFNVLLQVLDDGRLTDGQGHVVDFRNTILIMTSNLGSTYILEPNLDPQTMRERVMSAVRAHFRPEFLNRIDEIVIFRQLSREDILKIVDIQIRNIAKRLADRRITLVVEDSARQALADEGFDPVYGARPLKRTIQRELLDPLAMKLLQGELHEGSEVHVAYENGQFTFREVRVAEPALA